MSSGDTPLEVLGSEHAETLPRSRDQQPADQLVPDHAEGRIAARLVVGVREDPHEVPVLQGGSLVLA